ncbi:hypothetical protein MKX83_24165 [Cytobacillus sp. FSL M8-0252]|uniref:hypothetical protein n=1 Tax=Cytobacillus sp. FSL M8-0252 TaxID=2921621 RepID=UPI0030FC7412
MSIKIGDKNKIKKSTIGHQYLSNHKAIEARKKERFHEKHPIISNLIISIIGGSIVLFSFWNNLIEWIENLFK